MTTTATTISSTNSTPSTVVSAPNWTKMKKIKNIFWLNYRHGNCCEISLKYVLHVFDLFGPPSPPPPHKAKIIKKMTKTFFWLFAQFKASELF